MLDAGEIAPDFTLPNQSRQDVTLSTYRGARTVVLAFHPFAFTPVCSAQMKDYQQAWPALQSLDAEVLAISLDAGPSKAAWGQSLGGVPFQLLSDFHPHGAVTRAYGVMRDDGVADRAIFVVDKAGRIAWAKVHQMPEQPDLEELVSVLEDLKRA